MGIRISSASEDGLAVLAEGGDPLGEVLGIHQRDRQVHLALLQRPSP
jgi:hypothetical protein